MILVNASNLYVGGGMQVGMSVIEEFSKMDVDFIAAVSPPIFKQLSEYAKKNSIVINGSPSKLLNFGTRRMLDGIVKKYNVDSIFTVFGPSYWNPKINNHTVGFALPWLIYNTSDVISSLTLKQKIKNSILKYLQPYFFNKNAAKIVVETIDAKEQIYKNLHIEKNKIFVVPNTVSSNFKDDFVFDDYFSMKLPHKEKGDIWLLTISHDYPHKNLRIIFNLLELLPKCFKFVLTLDKSFAEHLSSENKARFIFLGEVENKLCPTLYALSDALFLPTLLECFSASYVEAGLMKKPIFTSNRGFSKTVCEDGAFYFEPLDALDIAQKILIAFGNPEEMSNKCERMYLIQERLPSAKERAEMYLKIISM